MKPEPTREELKLLARLDQCTELLRRVLTLSPRRDVEWVKATDHLTAIADIVHKQAQRRAQPRGHEWSYKC